MDPTDEELNNDWVPNAHRPQSAMAQSFQQDLVRLFKLDITFDDFTTDHSLEERRETLGKNNQELAALEAKLREMEQRLNKSAYGSSKTPGTDTKEPVEGSKTSESRPATAQQTKRAPSSGDMPPTPGASEDGDGDGDGE